MSTSFSTLEYILDQLSGLDDISHRKMFGEYCLYKNRIPIALICDNTFYVKKIREIEDFIKDKNYNYEEGEPFPGAKSWIVVDEDLIENREDFAGLILILEEVLSQNKKHNHKSV